MRREVPLGLGILAVAVVIAAACGLCQGGVAPPMPDNSWLLDDAAGATATAFTGSANGALRNGAAFDSDTPFSYAGNFCVLFDGDDDDVTVGDLATAFNGESAFSLSMWIRARDIGGGDPPAGIDRGFWEADANGDEDRFGLRYDEAGFSGKGDNVIKVGINIGGGNANDADEQYESAEGVQTTDWQHVAFVYEDGVGFKLYIDGVLDVPTAGMSNTTGALSDMDRFVIGDGPKANWDGRIDEVAVWRAALAAENVEWLSGHSLADIPEPATAALLLPGGALCALRRRRR
jgi:hypothetical protein